jgi:hypothetical protein
MKTLNTTKRGTVTTYLVDGVATSKVEYDAAAAANDAEQAAIDAEKALNSGTDTGTGNNPPVIGARFDHSLCIGKDFDERLAYLTSGLENVQLFSGKVKSVKPASNSRFQWVVTLNKNHTIYIDNDGLTPGVEVEGRIESTSSLVWTTPLGISAVLTNQGLPDLAILIENMPLLMTSLFRDGATLSCVAITKHKGEQFANPFANKVREDRERVKNILVDIYPYKIDIKPAIIKKFQAKYEDMMLSRGIDRAIAASGGDLLDSAVNFDTAEARAAV